MAFDIFGWLSTLCLAVSGIPQAIKTWKDGHARGLSFGMVFLWGLEKDSSCSTRGETEVFPCCITLFSTVRSLPIFFGSSVFREMGERLFLQKSPIDKTRR